MKGAKWTGEANGPVVSSEINRIDVLLIGVLVLWSSALGRLRRLESLRSKLNAESNHLRNALAESLGDKGGARHYKHRSPGRKLIGPFKAFPVGELTRGMEYWRAN